MKNEMFGNAKAFLNPIDWDEPFGMVMVESMACGTPVISFNKGAASEIIVDKKTGFLVKNKKEMVQVMKEVNKLKRKESRIHIEKNFTPIAAAINYSKIYANIIVDLESRQEAEEIWIPPTPIAYMHDVRGIIKKTN